MVVTVVAALVDAAHAPLPARMVAVAVKVVGSREPATTLHVTSATPEPVGRQTNSSRQARSGCGLILVLPDLCQKHTLKRLAVVPLLQAKKAHHAAVRKVWSAWNIPGGKQNSKLLVCRADLARANPPVPRADVQVTPKTLAATVTVHGTPTPLACALAGNVRVTLLPLAQTSLLAAPVRVTTGGEALLTGTNRVCVLVQSPWPDVTLKWTVKSAVQPPAFEQVTSTMDGEGTAGGVQRSRQQQAQSCTFASDGRNHSSLDDLPVWC
jgi:hypothetical protein